jgi:hypothetical protein
MSSAPEGTILKGLNYFKGRNDPVALKEEEYPEWLWHCLDVRKQSAEEEAAGDEFCKLICVLLTNSYIITIPPTTQPIPSPFNTPHYPLSPSNLPSQAPETNKPTLLSQIQESPPESRKSEAQGRRARHRVRRHEYSRTQDPDHAADD